MTNPRLLVARHGESSRRAGEYGLTLKGREVVQEYAQETARELGDKALLMTVHASPAQRTLETSILFAQAFGLTSKDITEERLLDSDRVWPDQERIIERVRTIGREAIENARAGALIIGHAPEVAWLAELDNDIEPPYGEIFEIDINNLRVVPE